MMIGDWCRAYFWDGAGMMFDYPSIIGHSDFRLLTFAVTVEFTARANVEKSGHFCIVNYGVNIAGGNA